MPGSFGGNKKAFSVADYVRLVNQLRMKRALSLLLFVLFCKASTSQVLIALIFGDKLNNGTIEFGLMTGPGFTSISNTENKTRTGVNLGLFFNFRITENFFLHPEAIPKASLGGKGVPVYATPDDDVNNVFASGSVDRRIKAISVPLLARYRIYKNFFVEAGPQLDWQLKVKDIFEADADDGNPLTYENEVTKQFNWLSMGFAGGLAWRFTNKPASMSLAARYYYGLTDIHKNSYEPGVQSNRGAFIFVYIPIGSNKAAKKAQQKQAQ